MYTTGANPRGETTGKLKKKKKGVLEICRLHICLQVCQCFI